MNSASIVGKEVIKPGDGSMQSWRRMSFSSLLITETNVNYSDDVRKLVAGSNNDNIVRVLGHGSKCFDLTLRYTDFPASYQHTQFLSLTPLGLDIYFYQIASIGTDGGCIFQTVRHATVIAASRMQRSLHLHHDTQARSYYEHPVQPL
jgi:hypothetical protein